MSRLPYEAFLALRYLRPRRTFVSVITVISIIGVLLGVAVLIVVIAVMSGFDKQWRDCILGFNAHLKVYPAQHDQPMANYKAVMREISANPNVIGVSPFIHTQVVAKTEPESGPSKPSAPLLFGVDPQTIGQVNILPDSIISGKFELNEKEVLVGRDYAGMLGLEVGDRLAIYSATSVEQAYSTAGKTNAQVALADDFTVSGIFDVGFPQFNSSIMVTSLDDARELQGMPDDTVEGLQVKLRDAYSADAVAEQLRQALPGLSIYTWRQESPEIFTALATEKNMMFFLLFFIMIVAAFGIVNCQITFVVQKTREIGILKSLGATNRQVLWLFLSQSIVVGALGVGLGLASALAALRYRNEFLDLMRRVTHQELLPPSIYHVYELPSVIQPRDILIICGTAFITCVLAGLFPAWKASRLPRWRPCVMSDTPATPMLAARNLHKSYAMGPRTLEVLRGIDLVVGRGEFLALRGASGAGKSTLLHLLGGLDLPNQGEILFDGADLRKMSSGALAHLRNRRVGFVFQAYHLLPELSALENVVLPARMARMPAHEAADRARLLLDRVGLGGRTEHRPSELSGGEQQRVAIARALINEPDLILADEPTGNLDSRTGDEIIQLLYTLGAERRATFIMATHSATMASRARRVIELVDGLLADGDQKF